MGGYRSIRLRHLGIGGWSEPETDTNDHSAGLEMSVWIGDRVDPGQPLLTHYHPSPDRYDEMLRGAIEIGDAAEPLRLIAGRVTAPTT